MLDPNGIRLTLLRKAIRNNRVTFPAQVPLFVRNAPADLQRYSIQLYFLRGWSCEKIARRYGYSRFYIWQIVNEWKRHAVALGYVQAIPPARALLQLKNALTRTIYQPAA
jgi:Homeodomain-like domain